MKRGILYCALILSAFNLSTINIMLSLVLHRCYLSGQGGFPLLLVYRAIYKKWMLDFVECFSHIYRNDHMTFRWESKSSICYFILLERGSLKFF